MFIAKTFKALPLIKCTKISPIISFKFCTTLPPSISIEEVEGKIYEVLRLIPKVKASNITNKATFEQLGLDSLDTVETIVSIEEMFGIDLPDKTAQTISDVNTAIQAFHKHLNELNKPKVQ